MSEGTNQNVPAMEPAPAGDTELLLSVSQQAALRVLAAGASISAAARDAGVCRMTLYRWLNHDARFRAAYNAWQHELEVSARSRLLKLADEAIDAVAGALKNGDGRSGLALLKGLGLLSPPPPAGPDEPQAVQRVIDLDQQEQQMIVNARAARLEKNRHRLKLGLSLEPPPG